ncbi:MAG: EAL domain-containing protein [Gallionellaceae bacterium]|nr:EAL domain-containing protein [Gallionellaceae bacterium]
MSSMPDTERDDGPILIVDDMPENLEVLGGILRDAGHAVRVGNSGAAALRYAALEPHPELILLDIMMPGMDGHEVLRRLRDDEATRDIPVLFLTALDEPQDIAAGLRLGAADYIVKPVQAEVVLARVRTQLEAKRARDWLRDQNAALEAEVRRRVAEAARIRAEADRAQALLARQRELILAAASDAIIGLDEAGIVRFANPATATLLGYSHDEMLGRPLQAILRRQRDAHPCPLCAACAAGATIEGQEGDFRNRVGYPLVLEFSCRPIVEAGRQAGSVVTLSDQSERRRYLEQLERKSNYDDLTGLPNRNLLKDRLARAVARHDKAGGGLAVLTLDLDRFKDINDSLGHAIGDQLLRAAAGRLAGRLGWVDTLARLDGDEFVVVAGVAADEVANRLARPLLEALATPFRLDGRDFYLGASLGIALHPKDGGDGDTLLRNAVAAMYRAKAAGGNRFNFYAAEMNARALERLDLENGLRQAIEHGELVLHYQAQANLQSGAITGVEALVRWQHPQRGLLMPDRFIDLAEETGLIVPLGNWVLRTACTQARTWQAAGLPPLSVAVNMSARQFDGQDITGLVAAVLADTGLAPQLLELELTESLLMTDAEAFIDTTARLKALAVRLAIDDFGTGFSSLGYLKRFAIDRLKIDRSFVTDIGNDEHSDAIVLAVISLAHSLRLTVIAEGVENAAQHDFLRAAGCDEMQGYYLSRPLPADAFAALLRDHVAGNPA